MLRKEEKGMECLDTTSGDIWAEGGAGVCPEQVCWCP